MRKELELQLVTKYPTLFKNYGGPASETLMHWGMAHDDGWYDLLDNLCQELMDVTHNMVATQVKEKFGGLVFYVDSKNIYPEDWEKIVKIREKYYNRSLKICEVCGAPGKRRGKQRVKTLCLKHFTE